MRQQGQLLTAATEIKSALSGVRRIALCGASDKPDRPSFQVMASLLDWGYEVIPVNPRLAGANILGRQVVGQLADIDGTVDMVDLFINSARVGSLVDEALALGQPLIWMQQGVIDGAATERAVAAGCLVVMDRCPKIDIPMLGVQTPMPVPAP